MIIPHFLFRQRHPGTLIRATPDGAWDAKGFGGYKLFRILRPIDRALTFPLRLWLGIAQKLDVRQMRRKYPRLA